MSDVTVVEVQVPGVRGAPGPAVQPGSIDDDLIVPEGLSQSSISGLPTSLASLSSAIALKASTTALDLEASTRLIDDQFLRRRSAVFARMIPVDNRSGHGISGTSVSDGVATGANSRIEKIAPCDIGPLALCFDNFRDGDSITSLGSVTVSAAIEYNSQFYPVWFNGSSSVVIGAGAIGVVSSPVGVFIPQGATYYVRTYVTVTSGQRWPMILTTRLAQGEGVTSGTSETSKTTSGTITASNTGAYTARCVLSSTASRNGTKVNLPVIGGYGDSILNGVGEVSPETDKGFLIRALNNLFSVIRLDRSGSSVNLWVNSPTGSSGSQRRGSMLDAVSTLVSEFGVNDLNGGRTLSQFQTDLLTVWKPVASRGTRIFQTTLTPWTSSTDSWTTTGGQTPTSWESTRVAFNTWLRAGAPLDPTTKNPVAVGTAGALLAGQSGHPLFGYFDLAAVAETGLNSGVWKVPASVGTISTTSGSPTVTVTAGSFVNDIVLVGAGIPAGAIITSGGGTPTLTLSANATATATGVSATSAYVGDGIHPSPAMHQLLAAAVDTSLFI